MTTYTATAAASTVNPRAVDAGNNSASCRYNSGTTALPASKSVVLMCKIPNNCTVIDIVADHTSGAANCPADYGLQGIADADLSTFATANTKGAISVKTQALPYDVSTSDGATVYVTFSPTPATATTSTKCNMTVFYRMN